MEIKNYCYPFDLQAVCRIWKVFAKTWRYGLIGVWCLKRSHSNTSCD